MKKLLCLTLCLALLVPMMSALAVPNPALPYKGDAIVYKGYAADLGITENRESPVYKAYKEQIGNVTIEWQTAPWSDFDEKTKIFLNTGDLPDIVWMRNSADVIRDYGTKGYFLNLMNYLDYMPNLKGYLQEFGQLEYLKAEDGGLYCVNDVEPYDSLQETWYYNKTKLDELGLKVPETYADMLECMKVFKEKYPDANPFITYGWGFAKYKQVFSQIINAKYDGLYFDGEKWQHSIADPASGHKELIEMIADLYAKGYIHPEFSTISNEQAYQVVVDGNWLFSYFYTVIFKEIFQGNEIGYEVAPMLTPAKEAGAQRYIALTSGYDTIPYWGYFVSAKVANPEVMAALLDSIISPESSDLFNWGVKGLTYDVDDKGNKYFLEDYATNGEKAKEQGVGNFMDVRYIMRKARDCEFARSDAMTKEATRFVTAAAVDGTLALMRPLRATPTISAANKEIVAKSINPMKTYADENEMLFVDGSRPISEWDKFVEEFKTYGNLDEALKIYEEGKQIPYSNDRKLMEFILK